MSPLSILALSTLASLVVTSLVMYAGARLFSEFRSAERKQGEYRADAVAQVGTSTRLPSVGGPAVLAGISASLGIAVAARALSPDLALSFLVLCWLQGGLGWIDDLAKSRGQGLSEPLKLSWLMAVAVGWSVWYAWAWLGPGETFVNRVAWVVVSAVFLMWITLCVSFSDGVDGLTAGLCAIAAAPFVAVALATARSGPGSLGAVTLGAALGALLLNQPSRWTRRGTAPRRARAYLGDSGALVLGTALGALTVVSRWEWLWLLAGAALVIEGTSVLVQTGVLVPLFRRGLGALRFRTSATLVPHTDFPLPFLATPFHHHMSLVGLGPLETVGSLYAIAAIGACLASVAAIFPRYAPAPAIVLGIALYAVVLLWSLASKGLFLLWSDGGAGGEVALCRGLPFAVGGLRLFVDTGDRVRGLPAATRLEIAPWLDRRMNRHDAAAALGLCSWAAGDRDAAARRWRSLPVLSLLVREEAAVRLAEHARSTEGLDVLLQTWGQALGQAYQEGRLEIVCARLARRAATEGMDGLACALREQAPRLRWDVRVSAGPP